MSIKIPWLSRGERQTRQRRAGHLLVLAAATSFAFTTLAVSGCGPLGLYNLLSHHHVLKPVVADEPPLETSAPAERFSHEDTSSHLPARPRDTGGGESAERGPSATLIGDGACHD